nr:hypothetical protein [Tanacetum cinerariifolium]
DLKTTANEDAVNDVDQWNTCQVVTDQLEKPWFNNMVSVAKDPLIFDELMATHIDFSNSIERKYNMEECFKSLTDRLNWNNTEGDHNPFDLTKPFSLKGRLGRLTIAAEYFFNNDLEFLKSSDPEKKYTTSITKTKAACYEIVGIENMVPTLWSTTKVRKLHGYGHLEEITARRANRQGIFNIWLYGIFDIETMVIATRNTSNGGGSSNGNSLVHDDEIKRFLAETVTSLVEGSLQEIRRVFRFEQFFLINNVPEVDKEDYFEYFLDEEVENKVVMGIEELKLGCRITPTGPLAVIVADGVNLVTTFECKNFKWEFDSTTFATDVMLLPLGGYEMVLGIEWMETDATTHLEFPIFSPFHMHIKSLRQGLPPTLGIFTSLRRSLLNVGIRFTPVRYYEEESAEAGSLRVIIYGYDGLLMQPVAPPSPDYVSGPEHLPSPDYVPGPKHPPSPVEIPYVPDPEYPKYLTPSDDEPPLEDQPLPADASPTAASPGYVADSDLEQDPDDDHVDYPVDRGDGDDEPPDDNDDDDTDNEDAEPFKDEKDNKEEEEHLAPADSSAVPIVDPTCLRRALKTVRLEPSMLASMEACIARHAALLSPTLPVPSSPLPLPSPLTTSPTDTGAPLGYKAARIRMRALLPSTSHRTDIPETDVPPQKRACLITPNPGFKVKESSIAGAARQPGDTESDLRRYRVEQAGYRITDTWDEIVDTLMEIALTSLEGAQDDRALLRAQFNTLFGDRPDHCRIAMLLDRKAMYAREAWAGSEDKSVAAALAKRDADRRKNGDNSNDSGTGRRRQVTTQRECSYIDFLKCQPMSFQGTEGVVGLTRWAIGQDVAYAMPWVALKRMITNKYYPRELALMCDRMFPEESAKVERYISGLPDIIHGIIKASKPQSMQEAIEFTTEMMDKKMLTHAERQAEHKRKIDDTLRNNQNQQQPFRRNNVARAYTAGLGDEKPYGGTKPICPKCNVHHDGPCAPKGTNCKKIGHLARDCKGQPAATNNNNNTNNNNQRAQRVNAKGITCFECGVQGHYKSDCPKLKNGNQGNRAGNGNALARAYAIETVGTNPNSNVDMGTFLLNNRYALILFDTGADRSFISTAFSLLIDIIPTTLDHCYDVELADEMGSFDVIIGMNWLVKHHVVIVCDEKLVRVPFDNKLLIFHGDESNNGHESRLNIISCTKTQRYLLKGCPIFLAHVTTKGAEDKSKEKRLEDVPIFQDFLEELSGIPPTSQVEFQIDSIPGVAPVAWAPNLLASSEMKELSDQLKELADKGFIRLSSSPWGALVLFLKKKDGSFQIDAQLIDPKLIHETTKKIVQIKQRIQAARDRQKIYAYVRRKPLEFQAGDRVMLKVSPWKGVVRFSKRGKLNARYIRPFKVLAKVGTVAYRLEHPEQLSRVHSTFHVSNLKKCLFDEPLEISLDEIHIDEKLRFIEEPLEIMDREVKWLKQSRIPIIKIQWNSKRGPEFTWECEDQFRKKYP